MTLLELDEIVAEHLKGADPASIQGIIREALHHMYEAAKRGERVCLGDHGEIRFMKLK
jgi:nucleoid DNA-binding protein